MSIEIRINFQPKQLQFLKAIEDNDVVGFGGARGSGKSYALRNIHLLRRFQYPGSTGVIFRESYKELEANHIRPLLTEFPGLREYYRDGKKMLSLPNSSVQLFRHCGSVLDAPSYQGEEWHDFAFEEAGNLTEELFDLLRASNRSSKANIPAKCQLTMNPGGRGHKWLKRRFISNELTEQEAQEKYCFIRATLEDNQALMTSDPNYERRLLSMGSQLLVRAWRYGDWDIEAGQYFSDLRAKIHFIEPFEIPPHWKRFGSFDWGWAHPSALFWWAVDEEGNCYVYRESIGAHRSIEEIAETFHSFEDSKKVAQIWAGHDCWVDRGSAFRTAETGPAPTIAEEFQKQRMFLMPANISRIQGAQFLRECFRYELTETGAFKRKPKIFIFNTCPVLWNGLTERVHDPDNIEDVLKEDAKEGDIYTGDDAYDGFRYGAMSRFGSTARPQRPEDKYSMLKYAKNRRPSGWTV